MSGEVAVAAALVAALISLVGLLSSHRKKLSHRATVYVLARLSIDAVSALVAAPIIAAAYPTLPVFRQPLLQVILAALVGPAFLRTQITLVGRKFGRRTVGPAVVFVQFMEWIDNSIDQISAVDEGRWMATKVIPALNNYSCSELGEKAEMYIKSLDRLDARAKTKSIGFIVATVKESSDNDEQAKRAILQHLLDNNGRRFVKDLVK